MNNYNFKWDGTNLKFIKPDGTEITIGTGGASYNANANIAPEYDKTSTYAKDALVIYEGKLYKAKSAILTAEAWTAAHWDETTISANLS